MNKNLEALLMLAAKATKRGVYGVDPKRAEEYGVELATLCRKGDALLGLPLPCETTGYYCASGSECLAIDAYSPGDGFTRYSVVTLKPESTGHYRFAGDTGMSLKECRAFLQGVIAGASQ